MYRKRGRKKRAAQKCRVKDIISVMEQRFGIILSDLNLAGIDDSDPEAYIVFTLLPAAKQYDESRDLIRKYAALRKCIMAA